MIMCIPDWSPEELHCAFKWNSYCIRHSSNRFGAKSLLRLQLMAISVWQYFKSRCDVIPNTITDIIDSISDATLCPKWVNCIFGYDTVIFTMLTMFALHFTNIRNGSEQLLYRLVTRPPFSRWVGPRLTINASMIFPEFFSNSIYQGS